MKYALYLNDKYIQSSDKLERLRITSAYRMWQWITPMLEAIPLQFKLQIVEGDKILYTAEFGQGFRRITWTIYKKEVTHELL